MGRKTIKRVTACYNIEDPDQLAEWQYVKSKTNASDFLKRAVREKMSGGYAAPSNVPTESTMDDQDDDLKGMLI